MLLNVVFTMPRGKVKGCAKDCDCWWRLHMRAVWPLLQVAAKFGPTSTSWMWQTSLVLLSTVQLHCQTQDKSAAPLHDLTSTQDKRTPAAASSTAMDRNTIASSTIEPLVPFLTFIFIVYFKKFSSNLV